MHACVRACMRVCVCVCVWMHACVCMRVHMCEWACIPDQVSGRSSGVSQAYARSESGLWWCHDH